MARSRRWSASEDIFSAQLSRVSIRYVLYLHALCIRLNAVWGAICIPLTHSLSLHLYLQYICGIYGEYRYILQQLPKTQLRTAAQAALCIQLFMHRQLDLSGCLGIPHPPPHIPPSLPCPIPSPMAEQSTCDNISKEATDRRHSISVSISSSPQNPCRVWEIILIS